MMARCLFSSGIFIVQKSIEGLRPVSRARTGEIGPRHVTARITFSKWFRCTEIHGTAHVRHPERCSRNIGIRSLPKESD